MPATASSRTSSSSKLASIGLAKSCEVDAALPSRLPFEIEERVIELAVDDALHRSKHEALVLTRVSRAAYPLVVGKVYESFQIGDGDTALSSSSAFKLAGSLHRRPSLADLVTSLQLERDEEVSDAMTQALVRLLAVIKPKKLCLHLAGRPYDLLPRVNVEHLQELYIHSFELRGSMNLDSLSAFISKASATLEILEFPALVHAEFAAFKEEEIPHCPNLRRLLGSQPDNMAQYLAYGSRNWLDTSYYESFAIRHAKVLTSFDLGPLSYMHGKKLSDLAAFPNLENVDIDDFRIQGPPGQALELAFEYQQLQDLNVACKSLVSLSFRHFYIVDPPQHLQALEACISCLHDKQWLPDLSYIELEGYVCQNLTDERKEEVVRICEQLFSEFKRECASRKVTLSGAFLEMMEENRGFHEISWSEASYDSFKQPSL